MTTMENVNVNVNATATAQKHKKCSKLFRQWKIGQINIRIGREDWRLEEAIRQMDRAKLSICAMQEVRRLGTGDVAFKVGKQDYYSGMKRRHEQGVGIIVKTDHNVQVLDVINVNARPMAIDVVFHGYKVRIVSAYSPNANAGSYSSKILFCCELKKLTSASFRQKNKIIICGDFNATSTLFTKPCSFRSTSIVSTGETTNKNG